MPEQGETMPANENRHNIISEKYEQQFYNN